MSDKVSLPASSFDELIKIIKGYGHINKVASLDEIAKLVGMARTRVSANNKFLAESGLISGGNKKSATDLGAKLGRALDHNQVNDIEACWKDMISSNKGISELVTTIRIKGGMTNEQLSAHILYISGQKNNKDNRTGANALVSILKASGLVEVSDDGKIVVAHPNDNTQTVLPEETPTLMQNAIDEEVDPAQLNVSPTRPKDSYPAYQVTTQPTPQIVINIQLHLPETDNPEVYRNLFKALKDNLLPKG